MQDYLKFNGKLVKQPDEGGYSAALATTSTEDSGRDMSLVAHNTPIGTVAAYNLKWKYITPKECSEILSEVMGKSKFDCHYFDIVSGTWKDAEFYAANFNAPAKTLKDGIECWDELSFQITAIRPR